MVDEPFKKAYGGAVAAPAFSAIAERVMSYMFPRPLIQMPQAPEVSPPLSETLSSVSKMISPVETKHQ